MHIITVFSTENVFRFIYLFFSKVLNPQILTNETLTHSLNRKWSQLRSWNHICRTTTSENKVEWNISTKPKETDRNNDWRLKCRPSVKVNKSHRVKSTHILLLCFCTVTVLKCAEYDHTLPRCASHRRLSVFSLAQCEPCRWIICSYCYDHALCKTYYEENLKIKHMQLL